MQVKTQKQITVLQAKAQKISNKLSEEIVIITKGVQHIQVQAGVTYQLNTQDFDINKLNLIAKKVGDDLEVASEDGVIIFDNYFEVCASDLSCLVSLPAKDGGLYHVIADIFFTLEDGTQVVYFYGDQSIVSTESSATDETTQSFGEFIDSNIGSIAVFMVAVLAIASSGSNSSNNDNDNNTEFSLNGVFSAGMYTGGKVSNAIFIYDKDGNQMANVDLKEGGAYTVSVNDLGLGYRAYTGTIYIRLKASNEITFLDEVRNAEATLQNDLYSIATFISDSVTAHINVQTTIATQVIVGAYITASNDDKKLIIGAEGSFVGIDKEKIERLEEVTRNALDLESNIFTTKVDTINSVGDEEGNIKAGQVAASLSGAVSDGTSLQDVIDSVAYSIDKVGALTAVIAGKLTAGLIEVKNKMKTDASTNADNKVAAEVAAQNAITGIGKNDYDNGTAEFKEAKDNALASAKVAKAKALADKLKVDAAADALVADTTFDVSPITNAGLTFSADTGVNNDLITQTKIQNISTTLNDSLETNESVWLSVNNGNWQKGNAVNNSKVIVWDNVDLGSEGINIIRVVVSKANDGTQVDAKKISAIAAKEYTLDATGSAVASVTISATDSSDVIKTGSLTVGDKVIVSIVMSEAVIVTANTDVDKPVYKVMIGDTEKEATYVSGSGTNTLKFSYTIVANETDNVDGITANANKLVLMGSGTITDIAGNVANLASPVAATNTIIIDTKAPNAPANLKLATDDDTGSNNHDNETSKTFVTIMGEAEANSTVKLFNGDTLLGSTTTDNSGNFSQNITLAADLTNITAKAIDASGNQSIASAVLSITLDTLAPVLSNEVVVNVATKVETSVQVYDAQATDGGDKDEGVTYSVTGGANKNLFEFKDDVAKATGILTYKDKQMTEADHTVIITATDVAGNTKEQTVIVHAKNLFTSVNWTGATDDNYIGAAEKSAVTLSGTIVGGENTVVIEKIEIFKDGIQVGDDITTGIIVDSSSKTWSLNSQVSTSNFANLADGTYIAKVTIKDGSNAPITLSSTSITYDTSAPILDITSNKAMGVAKADEEVTYTFTFNEKVVDFTLSDITIDNGVIKSGANLVAATGTDVGKKWTLVVIPDADKGLGTNMTVSVDANKVRDLAGNGVVESSNNQAIDTMAPTLIISDDNVGAVKAGTEVTYTFIFSEKVTGFTKASIAITNGTIKSNAVLVEATGVDADKKWTLVVTPNTGTDAGSKLIVSVPTSNSGITDIAGNAYSVKAANNEQDIDAESPDAFVNTISEIAGTDFVINASEKTNGFTVKGTISNASDGNKVIISLNGKNYESAEFTSGGKAWEINVPATDSVSITAGNVVAKLINLAGKSSAEKEHSFAINTTLPIIVDFTSTTSDGIYKIGDTIDIVATASETLKANSEIILTLNTGAIVALTTSSNSTTLTGTYIIATNQNSEDLSVSSFALSANTPEDMAGNVMIATEIPIGDHNIANFKAIVIDTMLPTLDIAFTGLNIAKIGDEVSCTFTFSEVVTGLTEDDIAIVNGAVKANSLVAATDANAGKVWTFIITPEANKDTGTNMTASLKANTVKDSANNYVVETTSGNQAIDTKAPTKAVTGSILIKDNDTNSVYNEGDELIFKFSENLSANTFVPTVDNNHSFGIGVGVSILNDTVVIILGNNSNLEIGDVISLPSDAIIDIAGNAAGASGSNIEFTLPSFPTPPPVDGTII